MSTTSRSRLELLTHLAHAFGATDEPVEDAVDDCVELPADDDGEHTRVAVLVLACALPEYDEAIRAIRATWAADRVDGVDVWFVYGNPASAGEYPTADLTPWTADLPPHVPDGRVWHHGDLIVAGCSDVIWDQGDCLLRKRLLAFAFLAALQRYDFIVTVCATSYVDQHGLKDSIRALPRTGVYQGPVGVCGDTGRPYVSGSCIVMSIDVAVALAGARPAIIEHNAGAYADDVALASWVAEHVSSSDAQVIADHIAAGQRPTDDATFVFPVGLGIDLLATGRDDMALVPSAWHYHLALQSVTDMEVLHDLQSEERQRRPRSPRVSPPNGPDDHATV